MFEWLKRPKKKSVNADIAQYIDSWNKQRAPTKHELVKDFEGVAYTCASKNAQGVARTRLGLYVTSGKDQKTRWKHKSVKDNWIDRKFSFADDDRVERVVDRTHPIAKLLEQPNPVHDGKAFLRYTQLYLEIVGTTYWRIDNNALGVPGALWILPPQQVRRLDNGNYEFRDDEGCREYPQDRIVRLTFDNLQNPYGEGYSPLRAIAEQNGVGNKLLAHLGTQLDNQARPDTIITGDFGEEEAERYEWKINSKFRRNNGGIAVLNTDADGRPTIKPLTFSPRDMSILQMLGYTKVEIANAFSVPLAMLETKDVNRANLQSSREMHAKDAILPRCDALETVLNKRIISLFDDSGRTFVAFANPSPEDRELDIAERTAQASQLTTLVTGSVITQNEAREELGLESVDAGDRLIGSVVMNITDTDTPTAEPETTEPTAEPAEPVVETEQDIETVPSMTLNGAQIQAASGIVNQVAQGLLPRIAGIGQLEVLLNLSNNQAERVMGNVGQGFMPTDSTDPTDSEPDENASGAGDSKGVKNPCKCKATKLPKGNKLVPILIKHFERQSRQVLGGLEKSIKKALPAKFVPIDKWTEELAEECFPVVEMYFTTGSKKLIADVGASAAVFSVSDPNVQKWLKQYVFKFADSTIKTTTKMLNDALSGVRKELLEGMDAGEAVNALTRRVENVFENATKSRAQLIAKTESQRSYIQGFQKTAIESGVVSGFKHLTSSDPCEICEGLSGKKYGLTDTLPPDTTHPGCECSTEAILTED